MCTSGCRVSPLRRPISICEVDREQGSIRILFDVRGEGTHVMAQMEEGDLIDVMGPWATALRCWSLRRRR